MAQGKIRSLAEMPEAVKLNYGKILALFMAGESRQEAGKWVELYRLMAYSSLAPAERHQVLAFLDQPAVSVSQLVPLWNSLSAVLPPQERSVLRFSLMKDALYLSGWSGQLSEEEEGLLQALVACLEISPDQLKLIRRELKLEEQFSFRALEKENRRSTHEILAQAAGIGAPLVLLACLGEKGKRGKKGQGDDAGLLKLLFLSYGVYRGAQWVLDRPYRKGMQYKRLVADRMKALHQATGEAIEADRAAIPDSPWLERAWRAYQVSRPRRI